MRSTNLRRGLAAGAVAGLLAGLVGVAGGAHTIDVAEELEHAAEHESAEHGAAEHGDAAELITREQARIGLVGGTLVAGLALGAVLGLASGPAASRLSGDAWQRTWKLGGAATAAVVVLPALAYPPVPPGAGDPDTWGARAGLYVAVVLLGVAIALAAAAWQKPLARTGLTRPARQAATGAAVVVAAGVALAVLPPASAVGGTATDLPAELVWAFRLESLAAQLALWLGLTAAFGLLAARAEHDGLRRAPAAAAADRDGATRSGDGPGG